MSCGVYKFENKINHKIYIGQSSNLEERYKKHIQNINDLNKDTYFYRALRKYGLQNFEYTILEEFEYFDQQQLDQLEDYYIKKYNSLLPDGYNMIPGGSNGSGLAKRKIVQQYTLDGVFIKEYPSAKEASKQTGVEYSDICACCRENTTKKLAGNFQWKYKNSDKIITPVVKRHDIQKIYQFNLKGELLNIYNNLDEAVKATKISKSCICSCCLEKAKTAGGFLWSYQPLIVIPQKNLGVKKKIAQYTKDGRLIATFESLTDASIQTGISKSNISSVCLNKRKTAGNYIWKYIE